MLKTAASKVAWVRVTASMAFVLVAVLVASCSAAGSGTQQDKAASAAPPKAKDDYATTVEGREVMIEMIANDTGRDLEIDVFKPGKANGDIICEAGIETGKIRSCAYTPVNGFTGADKFEYTVKDANGKTDSAMVYVRVRPAN